MKEEMIPTLRKAVEWAEQEARLAEEGIRPSQWDQGTVFANPEEHAFRLEVKGLQFETPCGSAYCIAGHIVAEHYGVVNPYDAPPVKASPTLNVMPHAADLLGLTDQQQWDLFDGGNSIEDVRSIAERIAGERL